MVVPLPPHKDKVIKPRNKRVKGLDAIEKEKKVKVVLAVESGSKAWNIQSFDSDFDVRFIFKRNIENFLKSNEEPQSKRKFDLRIFDRILKINLNN